MLNISLFSNIVNISPGKQSRENDNKHAIMGYQTADAIQNLYTIYLTIKNMCLEHN